MSACSPGSTVTIHCCLSEKNVPILTSACAGSWLGSFSNPALPWASSTSAQGFAESPSCWTEGWELAGRAGVGLNEAYLAQSADVQAVVFNIWCPTADPVWGR